MSADFGFNPCNDPGYYFVSYNSEDAERVGPIARGLHSKNVPLWYDKGIPYGEKWEAIIAEKIKNSQAVILFFTKGILFKEDSYVKKEYRIATKNFKKKVYVVMLDYIDDQSVPLDKVFWFNDIRDNQNIDIIDINDPDMISGKIMSALGIKNSEEKKDRMKNTEINVDTGDSDDDYFYSMIGGISGALLSNGALNACKPAPEVKEVHDAEESTLIKMSAGRMIIDNRYELKKIIGEGGFGVTYKAKDLKNQNIVAVKIGDYNDEYIIRLHQFLIDKTNDNLCKIYDASITSYGESYVAMEYLEEWKSLSCVKDYNDFYNNLGDDYLVGSHILVLINVLKGLKCLHSNGIVHADISPSNILTDGFSTKLIDYSSAFFVSDRVNPDSEHTVTISGYSSPESGLTKDFRSDLYSVGMVAFKWLTGSIPSADRDGRLILDNIKLDDRILRILKKATAFNPDDRYQSADDFIIDLSIYHSHYVENPYDRYDEKIEVVKVNVDSNSDGFEDDQFNIMIADIIKGKEGTKKDNIEEDALKSVNDAFDKIEEDEHDRIQDLFHKTADEEIEKLMNLISSPAEENEELEEINPEESDFDNELSLLLGEDNTSDNDHEKKELQKLVNEVRLLNKTIAVSSVGSADEAFIWLSSFDCKLPYIKSSVLHSKRIDQSFEDYIAECACLAAINEHTDFGVCISNIYIDEDSFNKYIIVCVSDSKRAKLKIVYALDNKPEEYLFISAATETYKMIIDFNPSENSSKSSVLSKLKSIMKKK